jgi:hypothetical protein
MIKIKRIMQRRRVYYIVATAGAAILSALLITGCGAGTSGSGGAERLIKEFSWLAPLGVSFVQALLAQYGTNLLGLLMAAAAALL